VTLDLRYVATCDRCQTAVALETREYNAAKRGYHDAGWRTVVEHKGLELLCAACLDKLDPGHRDALTERGARMNPSVTLTRPRYRPGVAPCAHCESLTTFSSLVVRMDKREHPANLYCEPCAIADARRRGYRAIVPEPVKRPKRKGAELAHTDAML
jgi:hypothetical protein